MEQRDKRIEEFPRIKILETIAENIISIQYQICPIALAEKGLILIPNIDGIFGSRGYFGKKADIQIK